MDLRVEYNETSAAFNCSAVSDASTPVSIRWYHTDIDEHGHESLVRNITDRVVIADNGTLMLFVPVNATDVWRELSGTYRCVATNGYSSAVATAQLIVSGVVPLPKKGNRKLSCLASLVALQHSMLLIFTSSAGVVVKYCDEYVCVCVCVCVSVSVCPQAYFWNHTCSLYQIFCVCCVLPWLGSPPVGC